MKLIDNLKMGPKLFASFLAMAILAAIVGFIGSFLLGFALLISIWRSGRF